MKATTLMRYEAVTNGATGIYCASLCPNSLILSSFLFCSAWSRVRDNLPPPAHCSDLSPQVNYHLSFILFFSFLIYYLFYELSFATYQNLCCFWTASWVQEIKGVLPHCFSALTFCFHIIWGKHWQKHIWYQPCGVQKGQKTSSKNVLKCLTEIIFFLKLWLYFIIFVPV